MASPGHRENILNCDGKSFGAGVGAPTDGTYYWTQVFGWRCSPHSSQLTRTGSGCRTTPNRSCTPSRISRARSSSAVVVPPPRWVRARVCFDEIATPAAPPYPLVEAGLLDQPGRAAP